MNGTADGASKTLILPTAAGGNKEYTPSAAVSRRLPSKWPRPVWHPPWKLFRVISGHLGYASFFFMSLLCAKWQLVELVWWSGSWCTVNALLWVSEEYNHVKMQHCDDINAL